MTAPAAALRKRFIIVVIILAVVFGSLFAYHIVVGMFVKNYMKNFAQPPATVNVVTVAAGPFQDSYDTIGNLVAVQGTDISPEVSGTITRINFNSGDYVKAGQVLLELDPQIQAAGLANAIANARLQKINYERGAILYKQGVISQSDFDTDYANYQEAVANVGQNQGSLAQKIIRAPFSGKVGIRLVSLGQYLNAGTVITNIQELNPIYVNFELPEQYLTQLYIGQPIDISVDTFPNQIFEGKISAFDAQVGSDTKSITVQATIPNTDAKMMLLPGMLAQLKVLMPMQANVISIPQEAISYTLYGNNVYIVKTKEDPKTHQTIQYADEVPITVGTQQGDNVVVLKGVNPGDEVIVNGQVKIQNGSPVQIIPGVTK